MYLCPSYLCACIFELTFDLKLHTNTEQREEMKEACTFFGRCFVLFAQVEIF